MDTSLTSPHEQQNDRIASILADGGRVPLSRIAAEAIPMEEVHLFSSVSFSSGN